MYKIVGADNREYGPVTKEEILQWIAAGRANAQTIARLDEGAWKPLASFDEFKPALNISGSTPPPLSSGIYTVPPTAVTGQKKNGLSIAALVFGILGVVCCCAYIGPILAIVLGVMGLNQIKANPSMYSTDASLPKIAIGLGIVGLVLSVLGSIFSTALGSFATKFGTF